MNRGELKDSIRQNLEDAKEKLNYIANTIPYLLNDVLIANVGKIFVM